MARRRYSPRTADHMAGTLAQHDGQCWVCDKPIFRLQSQVVRRRGNWVHVSCVPGWDE